MRQIVVLMMMAVVPLGVFAQRKDRDRDKRPPKEPVKVIENRKDKTPPPSNSNRPKPDNKKKPN